MPSIYVPPRKSTTTADLTGSFYTISQSDARFVHLFGDEFVAGEKTFTDDMTIDGNLELTGFVSENLKIEDNIITLNYGEAGSGITLGTAGLEIDRGTANDGYLVLAENTGGVDSDNRWMLDIGDGNMKKILYDDFPDDVTLQSDFYLTNLTPSSSGNFLTWDGSGKLIDSGISTSYVNSIATSAQSVTLQQAYDNGNTITHDNTNDIELFGNDGTTGLTIDSAGDATFDNEVDILDTTEAGSGQFGGAASIQGGLRLGYGLGGTNCGLFLTAGSGNTTIGQPEDYLAWINANQFSDSDENITQCALAVRAGADSGGGPNSTVVGIRGFADYNKVGRECHHPLIGVQGWGSNTTGPMDTDVYGVQGKITIGNDANFGVRGNTGSIQVVGVDSDVDAYITGTSNTKNVYGVRANVSTTDSGDDGLTDQYGGYFNSVTSVDSVPINYGIYASATGATENFAIYADGSIGITDGTSEAKIDNVSENLLVSGASQVIDQFSDTEGDAAKWTIKVKNGINLRISEVMAVWDGTSVEFTETSTNDLGDTSTVILSAGYSGSDVILTATTATSGWEFNSLRTIL